MSLEGGEASGEDAGLFSITARVCAPKGVQGLEVTLFLDHREPEPVCLQLRMLPGSCQLAERVSKKGLITH